MEAKTIHVGSVTNAAKGRAVLERNGFRVYTGRETDENSRVGCGYTLTVYRTPRSADLTQAAGILWAAGIRTADTPRAEPRSDRR